jgi:hypothetical protein
VGFALLPEKARIGSRLADFRFGARQNPAVELHGASALEVFAHASVSDFLSLT